MSKLILLFLLVAQFAETSIGSAFSPSSYWKSVLPNTFMPDALQSLLPEDTRPRYGGKWVVDSGICLINYIIICRPPKGLFLLEKDLKPSMTMDISFLAANINSEQKLPTFLPRQAAEALPFSTSSFPTILRRFSLSPHSPQASAMKVTLDLCESPAIKGETRFCATSLESMVDFATTQLGTNNLRVLSTLVHQENKTEQQLDQSYVVRPGIVKMESHVAVACHLMSYPYAVFYCHKTMDTKSFVVPLMAEEDGSRVDAAVVCHDDTSHWDPRHASFKVLGVEPGTASICHFLPPNHFLWVSK
ncbi:BURP domain-containing protein 5-like [Nymphaea colorata]|nr:BURP domain-containing protein 5-like [Nymphaea colorata]